MPDRWPTNQTWRSWRLACSPGRLYRLCDPTSAVWLCRGDIGQRAFDCREPSFRQEYRRVPTQMSATHFRLF